MANIYILQEDHAIGGMGFIKKGSEIYEVTTGLKDTYIYNGKPKTSFYKNFVENAPHLFRLKKPNPNY